MVLWWGALDEKIRALSSHPDVLEALGHREYEVALDLVRHHHRLIGERIEKLRDALLGRRTFG